MNHDEATSLLLDYAERALDSALSEMVEKHVVECPDCRGWLETHDFLDANLSCSRVLDGELLARYAVDQDRLDETEVDMVRAHLEVCGACGEELESLRAALGASRHDRSEHAIHRAMSLVSAVRQRSAAIAAVVVLSVLVGTTFAVFRGTPWLQRKQRVQETTFSGAVGSVPSDAVVIKSTRVETGARLTINSRNTVVFGEGFSVARDASLVVGAYRPGGDSDVDYQ